MTASREPQTEAGQRTVSIGAPVLPTQEIADSWTRKVLLPEVLRIEDEAVGQYAIRALVTAPAGDTGLREALEAELRKQRGLPALMTSTGYQSGIEFALRALAANPTTAPAVNDAYNCETEGCVLKQHGSTKWHEYAPTARDAEVARLREAAESIIGRCGPCRDKVIACSDPGHVALKAGLAALRLPPATASTGPTGLECPMCGGEGRIFDITEAVVDAQAAGLVLVPLAASTGLDAAWRDVEAALRERRGWDWSVSIEHWDSGDGYFEPHYEGFRATAHLGTSMPEFATLVTGDYDDDPAAALATLAARLRPTPPAQGAETVEPGR